MDKEASQITLKCPTHYLTRKIRNNLIDLGYAASKHGKSVVVICYNLTMLKLDLMKMGYSQEEVAQ